MFRLIESAAPEPETPTSQASEAYARIKRDILTGRAAPGSKLKIVDLAVALNVSPGAIREALSRLAPEGLVVSRSQRGFIVAPLSIEDLEDLTNLRCEIEAIALRKSVANGQLDWETSVLAAAHRLRRTPMTAQGDVSLSPEWAEAHAAFHTALLGACGSPRLLELHAQLYEQSERYRGLSVRTKVERGVAEEHQAICDAALDRDADRLVELMLSHLHATTDGIVQAAREEAAADAG